MSTAPAHPAWPEVAPPAERKSDRTRAAIVSAALELFRDHGYEGTTMRAIAGVAGVSPSSAYYYFRSKEELVQGFFDRLCVEHADAAEALLSPGGDFEGGLRGVLRCWLDIAEPYHPFAGRFFGIAAQPSSLLGASSDQARSDQAPSGAARDAEVALYARLVETTATGVDPRLRPELPELLWLYHLGVVLFWAHDRSPGLRRTALLVDRTVPMVARLIRLSRLRVFRPVSTQAADLMRLLRN